MIDVGVHYPIETDDVWHCACGEPADDRDAVARHASERSRELLQSATPEELGQLIDKADDFGAGAATAAARALLGHGDFAARVRDGLRVIWQNDGSLHALLGEMDLHSPGVVSKADREFLAILQSMTSTGHHRTSVWFTRIETRIRAADRLLLADAIDAFLLPYPNDPGTPLPRTSVPTPVTDLDEMKQKDYFVLAEPRYWSGTRRQEAARFLRDRLIQPATPTAVWTDAQQRAAAIASPTSARPAAGAQTAVAVLAAAIYAAAVDHDVACDEIAPTVVRQWLGAPNFLDLTQRTLLGTPAASSMNTTFTGDVTATLPAVCEQAIAFLDADIAAAEDYVQPGEKVLARTTLYGFEGKHIYWPATVNKRPAWEEVGPQPSLTYGVTPQVQPNSIELAGFEDILREYHPDDLRGAGTHHHAVRCGAADLHRAAFAAAQQNLNPGMAIAEVGERAMLYTDREDIYSVMITAFVDLLTVKHPDLPIPAPDITGEQLMEEIRPLLASLRQPCSPQQRDAVVARLSTAAHDADQLLTTLL